MSSKNIIQVNMLAKFIYDAFSLRIDISWNDLFTFLLF